MSLSDFVKKLQSKPRPMRIFILWISVGFGMMVISILWLWSSKVNQYNEGLVSQAEIENPQSLKQVQEEIPSLWQNLKASLSGLMESQNKESPEANKSKKSTEEVPPQKLP